MKELSNTEREDQIEELLEEVILSDSHRGMDVVRKHLPDHTLLDAAGEILSWKRGKVLLTTGFYVRGFPETDGPVGTFVLAKALQSLSFSPLVLTDGGCEDYFAGTGIKAVTEAADVSGFSGLISIERCGRCADGDYKNMRSVSIKDHTSPFDDLFLLAEKTGIPTIGIGDGGNEIGMGNVRNVVQGELHLDPCVVPCDHLIAASVSNWGAYGLAAALSVFTKKPLLPEEGEAERFLEHTVLLGSIDGVTGKAQPTVDGRAPGREEEILSGLRDAIRQCEDL